MSAMVDLEQQTSGFCESFYTLVGERDKGNIMMHMWRLVISSNSDMDDGK